MVYAMPNIYELTAAACVENMSCRPEVSYRNFVLEDCGRRHFEQFIKSDTSDVYIFWTVNLSLDTDIEAVRLIRAKGRRCTVIFIGPGATYYTRRCLHAGVDYVVRGEPEESLVSLLRHLERGTVPADVAALSLLRDGDIVETPAAAPSTDFDRLPFPARHFTEGVRFFNPKLKTGPYTTILTSRNCPYHCIYCVPSSLTFAREIEHRKATGCKPPVSMRSVESVDRELDLLQAQGYKAIGIVDDNFIWNHERTRRLCESLHRHGMVWGCQARADAIDDETAMMLAQSGCRYVDLGIESFDDDILRYIHKGLTADCIRRAIRCLARHGVPVKANVLIGSSPLETRRTVLYTLAELRRLPVDQIMVNIVSPFPATEYYDMAVRNGWLREGHYSPRDVQHEASLELPNLSAHDMERLLRRANLQFFLSPQFVIRQLRRFTSFQEFVWALKALRRKLLK